MSLYVLVVTDPAAPRGLATWYFDSHAQFLRAEKLARESHIFVSTQREFISDNDEFRTWVRERARENT